MDTIKEILNSRRLHDFDRVLGASDVAEGGCKHLVAADTATTVADLSYETKLKPVYCVRLPQNR